VESCRKRCCEYDWAEDLEIKGVSILSITPLEALGAEVCLKHLEELLDKFCLAQSLSEVGDCGGIRSAVHHTKPDKFLKGAPVIHLEFKLLNRKRKATPTLRLKSSWRTSILEGSAGQSSCALHCSCACARAHSPCQAVVGMIAKGLNQPGSWEPASYHGAL